MKKQLTKMDVVNFLRKKGYEVILSDEDNRAIYVNGERSWISLLNKQEVSGCYRLQKPRPYANQASWKTCYFVFTDQTSLPVYSLDFPANIIQIYIYDSVKKYSPTLLGYLNREREKPRNPSWDNYKKLPRVNGKFAKKEVSKNESINNTGL